MLKDVPIGQPDQLAVFLDLDGTLVEIAEHPDLVHVPADLPDSLGQAHQRLTGALALISGRSIETLDKLLSPLKLPAAGVHGLEFRDANGQLRPVNGTTVPASARQRLTALARSNAAFLLEDKGGALAFHFRQVPEAQKIVETEMRMICDELGPDFCLQPGKMVIELRAAGVSKGSAILDFMAAPPFSGRRPVFIGDDITDEDGFKAVNGLHGYSVRVGPTDLPTAACYALDDVRAVQQWLEALAAPANE